MHQRPSVLIAPSILSADFAHLQEEVDSVAAEADWLQVDVMDGHFVPNLSFGAPVVKCLKTKLPIDIHLMVENPEDRIEEFLELGVSNISFHAEVTDAAAQRAIMAVIRDGGVTAGIALNPQTPLAAIDDVLEEIDLLLIMSVQPGFGGQAFMPHVLDKVREARKRYPKLMIQMDGGIDANTAKQSIEAGANNLVAGSFIFHSKNRPEAIRQLRGT